MTSPINSQGVQSSYLFRRPPKRKEEPLLKQVLIKNARQSATVSVPDSELISSPESIKAHQQQENNAAAAGNDLLQVAEAVNATASSRMCTIL